MTPLETSYRRTLRAYPKAWRQQNERVILGTLLDLAEAEQRTTPRRIELVHLAVAGLLTRFGLWLATTTRDWISTVALGMGAAMAVGLLLSGTWMPWSRVLGPYVGRYIPEANPLLDFGIVIYALWILGFVASLVPGQHKTARAFMVVALAAPLVFEVANGANHLYGPNGRTLVFFTIMSALVLLGTPRWNRVGYVAAATSIGIVFLWIANAKPAIGYIDDRRFWDALVSPDKLAIAIAIAAAAAVYLNVRYQAPRQVIFVLLVPWIVVCCAGYYLRDPMDGIGFAVVTVAAFIVAESIYRGLANGPEAANTGRNRIGA